MGLFRFALYALISTTILPLSPSFVGAQEIQINGAGSTFVNPAMARWTEAYRKVHPNIRINYQALGSGAGIGLFSSGTVNFGATDTPMTNAQISDSIRKPVHIPVIAGAVTVAYNVPNIGKSLRLSGDVIADIFLGKITKWDDSRLASLNPGVKLPSLNISVCHRADSSGTTFIFTDFLSSVSPEWATKIGKGKIVGWPVGTRRQGNSGVGAALSVTPGGIGYVELSYALKNNLEFAAISNKTGKFILPSVSSTQATLTSISPSLKSDMRLSLVNVSGNDSYPICGVTYIILPETADDETKYNALIDFVKWIIGPGQEVAASLSYTPLPSKITAANLRALSGKVSKGQL